MQKIVMPKVFDEFVSDFDTTCTDSGINIKDALTYLLDVYKRGVTYKFNSYCYDELGKYMWTHGGLEFYAKCVQALAYGYTVELEKQYYVAVDGTDLFFSKDDHDNLTTVKGDLDSIKRRECIKGFESISARFTEDEIVEYGLAHYPREQAQ